MRISAAISFLIVITSLTHESFVIATGKTVNGRITGGTPAAIGEFPHVVAIKVDKEFRCGGFIYNERWVITTASCVYGFTNLLDRVTVEAGVVSLDSTSVPSQQLIRIESFHVYDSYDESLTGPLHDLALIQTNSPFIFDSYVNFSYYDELSQNPEQLIFTGWGSTTGNGGLYSNELQNATITLNYNSTICQLAYEIYNDAYMICTGDELDHASPCYYDEGSPLMQNGFVVGVMSRNKGCDAAGTIEPTIFTRLSPYYNWISTTAGLQPVLSNLSL
ncbi:chymotrypsin-1-like isoform X1 [Daphnia pulex]|uniref:chymotrypsin-1-like isoform X1 n=1 Tax=Daphnia pulex TaxID=6669 RepID=UPI001EDED532|nr:chymotrypsin-1-like isoform X1 [Daphnia pulex]